MVTGVGVLSFESFFQRTKFPTEGTETRRVKKEDSILPGHRF